MLLEVSTMNLRLVHNTWYGRCTVPWVSDEVAIIYTSEGSLSFDANGISIQTAGLAAIRLAIVIPKTKKRLSQTPHMHSMLYRPTMTTWVAGNIIAYADPKCQIVKSKYSRSSMNECSLGGQSYVRRKSNNTSILPSLSGKPWCNNLKLKPPPTKIVQAWQTDPNRMMENLESDHPYLI